MLLKCKFDKLEERARVRKRKGDSREMEGKAEEKMNKRERADERRPGLGREGRG